ncbi:Sigma-fimbriae tip adhesin [Candidatus Burkholderia brachyanthoides]|nr:Sigma-fimbriae tip adhesin [Candidatus Burkholderia brachyanthoides]
MNFGEIAPATTSAATATGTLSLTCTGLVNLPVRTCVSFDTGTGGSSYAPRLAISGTNTLQYNLYNDSAGTSIWGFTAIELCAGDDRFPADRTHFPLTALISR